VEIRATIVDNSINEFILIYKNSNFPNNRTNGKIVEMVSMMDCGRIFSSYSLLFRNYGQHYEKQGHLAIDLMCILNNDRL
jgi:hypothetical protein